MLKTKGNGKMVMTENLVNNKANNKRSRKLTLLGQITREVMSGNFRLATNVNYITLADALLSAKSVKRKITKSTKKLFLRVDQGEGKVVHQILKKNKTYVWGDKQEESFRILKEKLCNALILVLLDGPNDFVVYCNASNQGFGCVLTQRDALSRKERLKPRRVRIMSMTRHSGLKTKNLEAQGEASKDLKAPTEWLRGLEIHFERQDDGGIYFFDRIWIPSVGGGDLYWWSGMKRDIAEYVSKCLTLRWSIRVALMASSLEGVSWDTRLPLVEFSYNNSYHKSIKCAPFEALYGRVVRFGNKGKLAPRYVGPYEIVECVGPVAYHLRLPQELRCVYDVFYVSNLKKCLADSYLQVPLEEIKVDNKLYFVEEPVEIIDRQVKKLK
nr:reverse transcriptase domain-containing protein [Tanacetum cinerariifolium]